MGQVVIEPASRLGAAKCQRITPRTRSRCDSYARWKITDPEGEQFACNPHVMEVIGHAMRGVDD